MTSSVTVPLLKFNLPLNMQQGQLFPCVHKHYWASNLHSHHDVHDLHSHLLQRYQLNLRFLREIHPVALRREHSYFSCVMFTRLRIDALVIDYLNTVYICIKNYDILAMKNELTPWVNSLQWREDLWELECHNETRHVQKTWDVLH